MIEKRVYESFDWGLAILLISIVLIGLLNLYSATYKVDERTLSPLFSSQLLWVFLGMISFSLFLVTDYRFFEKYAWLIYGLTLCMLVYVLVGGRTIAGSKRWIDFGIISFQPSEIAKISVIIVLAKYFSTNHKPTGYTLKDIVIPFIIIIVPAILILKEPDLGTSLIILSIFFTVLIFVGLKFKGFLNIMIAGLSLIPIGWFFILKEYQKDRIRVFLNPESDRLGDAWHITQSVIAIGSGKLFGKGYLSGTQTKLEFVPKQHTDFIFSVFSEEWGFIGTIIVIILFLLLLAKGIDIASKSKDRFGAILAVGVVALIFWQTFINMGMELSLLPVVGITLPFFSYGGSAMLVTFIGVALLANVSMRRHIF